MLSISIWLLIGVAAALFVAWNNGSNNAANMVGTAVGARVISAKKALLLASIACFIGALSLGVYVTNTMMRGIVNVVSGLSYSTVTAGMISALIAAGIWTLISSFLRVPMSVHVCVIGGILGFGLSLDISFVNWSTITRIFIAWMLVPPITSLISYTIFKVLSWYRKLRKMGPLISASSFIVVFSPTFLSLLKVGGTALNSALLFGISVGAGLTAALLSNILWRRVSKKARELEFEAMRILLIEASLAMSFSFGANDVANSAGALAAIMYAQGIENVGKVLSYSVVISAIGLSLGALLWGSRVIETVGERITPLSPSSAFAAQLSAALVMLVVSRLGLPVSTSMAIVGGVMGVGMARGIRYINARILVKIFAMWFSALPITAVMAYVLTKILLLVLT